MLFDDPIVYARKPGRSHHHTFFGNTSINAFSTLRTLRSAGTTCGRKADTAAYWAPTLLKQGRPIKPLRATAYYQLREFQHFRPYPPGLKVVAGAADAVSPQPLRVVFWNCGAGARVGPSSDVPKRCPKAPHRGSLARRPVNTGIELHVNFPDCWDGRHLDSRDHRSHMAYSKNWRCPPTHLAQVPKLTLIVRYPIRDGRAIQLASGGRYSAHADFFNAWNQAELRRIVEDCSHARPRCGRKR